MDMSAERARTNELAKHYEWTDREKDLATLRAFSEGQPFSLMKRIDEETFSLSEPLSKWLIWLGEKYGSEVQMVIMMKFWNELNPR